MEEWRVFPEHPEYYVSNTGKVKKVTEIKEFVLGQFRYRDQETVYVSIGRKGVDSKNYPVKNLVYDVWIGNRNKKLIGFKDNNPSNLHMDNLILKSKNSNYSTDKSNYFIRTESQSEVFNIPVLTHDNPVKNEPVRLILKTKVSDIKKLQNEDYQKMQAKKLDDFLLTHLTHGVYKAFKQLIYDRDERIKNIMESKKFNMNKYNIKDESIQLNQIANEITKEL